nr:MAG TPA: hypothetical protein [Caudoviricetes sp.]
MKKPRWLSAGDSSPTSCSNDHTGQFGAGYTGNSSIFLSSLLTILSCHILPRISKGVMPMTA